MAGKGASVEGTADTSPTALSSILRSVGAEFRWNASRDWQYYRRRHGGCQWLGELCRAEPYRVAGKRGELCHALRWLSLVMPRRLCTRFTFPEGPPLDHSHPCALLRVARFRSDGGMPAPRFSMIGHRASLTIAWAQPLQETCRSTPRRNGARSSQVPPVSARPTHFGVGKATNCGQDPITRQHHGPRHQHTPSAFPSRTDIPAYLLHAMCLGAICCGYPTCPRHATAYLRRARRVDDMPTRTVCRVWPRHIRYVGHARVCRGGTPHIPGACVDRMSGQTRVGVPGMSGAGE